MRRLVASPVFLFSLPRSGSTLLRCMLDSNPSVCAPAELVLTSLEVRLMTPFVEFSMHLQGLDSRELEHALWDRILYHMFIESGKDVIVAKDPRNVWHWERFRDAWPEARYIFLLRHPGSIHASFVDAKRDLSDRLAESRSSRGTQRDLLYRAVLESGAGHQPLDEALSRQAERLEEARQSLSGLTVRYEDLVVDAARVTGDVCDYLDVPFDSRMLDYGSTDHGPLIAGAGDWGAKIRTGQVVPGRPLPEIDRVPDLLVPACRAWGYAR